jgi:hypothetical protein
MPSRRLVLTATLACVLSGASWAAAQSSSPAPKAPAADASKAEMTALVDAVRANRKALVAVNLALSDEEAAKFWPLYDRYQSELAPVGDRIQALVLDYSASFKDLSDDKAKHLMDGYLAAEADRLQIRRTYLGEFEKILPGRTVARFYQLENKFDAILRYELAATIPVVDEKPAAPPK